MSSNLGSVLSQKMWGKRTQETEEREKGSKVLFSRHDTDIMNLQQLNFYAVVSHSTVPTNR